MTICNDEMIEYKSLSCRNIDDPIGAIPSGASDSAVKPNKG